jgi:cytochrome c biogenesis protein CcmG, thiol:disulfide interchange protein DsbE
MKGPSSSRHGAALALACGLSVLAGCSHGQAAASPGRSAQVGRRLELAAPDLTGRTVDVAADAGRVRVVDFWATWCEPCRESLPILDALARELGPRGLSVYTVSFDEDEAQIGPFLKSLPIALPVLFDRGGDRLQDPFSVSRLPTTLIVDRKGLIRYVHEGWTPDRARQQRREVEQLLAEPP